MIIWLGLEQVRQMHDKILQISDSRAGIRDVALLESALARPQFLYDYGEHDVFQLAAAYAEAIARNHAFIDGNKRTAFQCADIFLWRNGYVLLERKDDVYVDMMESLGQGHLSRAAVAQILQANARALQPK